MEAKKYILGLAEETAYGTPEAIASADLMTINADRDLKGAIEQVDRNVWKNVRDKLATLNTTKSSGGSFGVEGMGGGATDPTPDEYKLMLEAAFGQAGTLPSGDGATHGTTACTTTSITTDAASSGIFSVNDAIGIQVGASSKYEVAWITAVTVDAVNGDTLTVEPAFSTAPGIGVTIKRAYLNTLAEGNSAYSTGYTIKEFFDGLVASSKTFTHYGCRATSLALSTNAGDIVTINAGFMGIDFTTSDNDDASGLSYTAPTSNPTVGLLGKCVVGSTTYDIQSFSLNMDLTNEPMKSLQTAGLSEVKTGLERNNTGTFEVYHDTHDFLDDFKNNTKNKIFIQCGSTIGYTIAVRIVSAKYTDYTISNDALRKGSIPFTAEALSPTSSMSDAVFIAHL